MATIFTFNATTHIPTDPQVLAVYNSLNRAQRATYDTLATDRKRSIFLNGIAEERRKSRHYLNLIHAVINLLSVIGFNVWSYFQKRDGNQDFIKCWDDYKQIVLQVSKRDIYHRSSHYWGSVGVYPVNNNDGEVRS
ncbi:hypothetical protein RhiirA5_423150 [Rhizophagus irregularis]|uniref:Uncharacterized protein n=1 Tax=Rhizophagus irregularis TaxID=588596 RepID=A0A2N0PAJ5_9GLOM|nr:hypothetical protein RhiirA5_423150 [Rhizophagus irregularis]